jgi:hypothetical protein
MYAGAVKTTGGVAAPLGAALFLGASLCSLPFAAGAAAETAGTRDVPAGAAAAAPATAAAAASTEPEPVLPTGYARTAVAGTRLVFGLPPAVWTEDPEPASRGKDVIAGRSFTRNRLENGAPVAATLSVTAEKVRPKSSIAGLAAARRKAALPHHKIEKALAQGSGGLRLAKAVGHELRARVDRNAIVYLVHALDGDVLFTVRLGVDAADEPPLRDEMQAILGSFQVPGSGPPAASMAKVAAAPAAGSAPVAAGSAPAAAGSAPAAATPPQPPQAARLQPEHVSEKVKDVAPAIKECFEKGLRRKRDLAGSLKLVWTIKRDGSVAGAHVEDDGLRDQKVTTCMIRVVSRLKFPPPGEDSEVSFPFSFKGN